MGDGDAAPNGEEKPAEETFHDAFDTFHDKTPTVCREEKDDSMYVVLVLPNSFCSETSDKEARTV